MIDSIIVTGIVVTAVVLVGRSFYRATTGKKSGCGCGEACPMSDKCGTKLTQIKIK